MSSGWHYTTRGLAYRNMTTNEGGLVSPYANLPRGVMPFWTHAHALSLYYRQVKRGLVVVVILSPEEYNSTHSICTTYLQLFHKCMPFAIATEAEAYRADNRELTVIQIKRGLNYSQSSNFNGDFVELSLTLRYRSVIITHNSIAITRCAIVVLTMCILQCVYRYDIKRHYQSMFLIISYGNIW